LYPVPFIIAAILIDEMVEKKENERLEAVQKAQ
jgi:hypothetical protein